MSLVLHHLDDAAYDIIHTRNMLKIGQPAAMPCIFGQSIQAKAPLVLWFMPLTLVSSDQCPLFILSYDRFYSSGLAKRTTETKVQMISTSRVEPEASLPRATLGDGAIKYSFVLSSLFWYADFPRKRHYSPTHKDNNNAW